MPGHVLVSSYHRSADRASRYVTYMTHREERLPGGETRTLHTFGERYDALRQHAASAKELEDAVRRQLVADARGIRPVYHTPVLTVNDQAAAVLRQMPRTVAEQRLSTALQAALRATAYARRLEGAYVIQWHGGAGRAAHPHIHVIVAPRVACRPTHLTRRNLDRMRAAWGRELDRSLGLRPERTRSRTPEAPERVPGRAGPGRPQDRSRQARPTTRATPLRLLRGANTVRRYVRNPVRAAAGDATRAAVRALVRAITSPGPGRAMASAITAPRAAATLVATKATGPLAVPVTFATAIARSAVALVRSATRGI